MATLAPSIIDRGRGPEIAGTRITVYTILMWVNDERSAEWIADHLNLTTSQVRAAFDYIEANRDEVEAVNAEIEKRIRRGNPDWVKARASGARARLLARRDEIRAENSNRPAHDTVDVG